VYEDETGSYIYNSKDLCRIEFIDQILDAGVMSLKIEGRMKSIYYCANTTRIYRQAVDSYLSGNYTYNPEWLSELYKMSHRGYTSGFFHGKLDKHSQQLELVTPKNKNLTLGPVIDNKTKETITVAQPNMHVIAKTNLENLDILISSQNYLSLINNANNLNLSYF
jgi:collagenase-like PrtC family protease